MSSKIALSNRKKLKELGSKILYYGTTPYRVFRFLCFWIGFVTLTSTIAIALSLYHVYSTLPEVKRTDFQQLKSLAGRSVLKKLETGTPQKAFAWTELNEVSRDCLYSIVLSEDSSFFDHDGLDYDAIVNSLAENLRKKKYEYGASTISQQVVKNVFLTQEKSILRKLKEFWLTEQIEKKFSKNQILEIYLNLVEFGPNLFGIQAASQHFFGKPPRKINAAEGAFLALMLPSPRRNYYSIFQNQNIAPTKLRKIRRILGDMLANEYISHKQYRQYVHYRYFHRPASR